MIVATAPVTFTSTTELAMYIWSSELLVVQTASAREAIDNCITDVAIVRLRFSAGEPRMLSPCNANDQRALTEIIIAAAPNPDDRPQELR